jgi:ATP-binding cassette subfamily F protein uup
MNFLTLENITKSYGEKVLFQNLSLYIDKGQKIGLIAKNGTGKTTLMRVIAGLEGSEGNGRKSRSGRIFVSAGSIRSPGFIPNWMCCRLFLIQPTRWSG